MFVMRGIVVFLFCFASLIIGVGVVVGEDDYKTNPETEAIYQKAYELYFGANRTNESRKKAIPLYQEAAELGHRVAQWRLHRIYLSGDLISKDVDKAIKWLLRSADQGYLFAQSEMGLKFSLGAQGVEIDHERAQSYLLLAMNGGHPDALAAMSVYYLTGEGVEQDLILGNDLINKARNIFRTPFGLDRLHQELDSGAITNINVQTVPKELLRQLACSSNDWAQYFSYQQSTGQHKRDWLKVSASSGNPLAIYRYNEVLSKEDNVHVNELVSAYELMWRYRDRFVRFAIDFGGAHKNTTARKLISDTYHEISGKLSKNDREEAIKRILNGHNPKIEYANDLCVAQVIENKIGG